MALPRFQRHLYPIRVFVRVKIILWNNKKEEKSISMSERVKQLLLGLLLCVILCYLSLEVVPKGTPRFLTDVLLSFTLITTITNYRKKNKCARRSHYENLEIYVPTRHRFCGYFPRARNLSEYVKNASRSYVFRAGI